MFLTTCQDTSAHVINFGERKKGKEKTTDLKVQEKEKKQ